MDCPEVEEEGLGDEEELDGAGLVAGAGLPPPCCADAVPAVRINNVAAADRKLKDAELPRCISFILPLGRKAGSQELEGR